MLRAHISSMPPLSDAVVSVFCRDMAIQGFHVIPGILESAGCDRMRDLLARAIDDYRPGPTQQSQLDRYLIHDLLCRDAGFAILLEDPRLQQLLAPLLGASWIMYAFTSSSLPPHGSNYGRRIHVDSPRFVPGYTFNVGVMWALDDFTAVNGGTELLPGSHLAEAVPEPGYFADRCTQVTCARGSLIVFNGRTFHRAGDNTTDEWRHALTMNACRSYMKQRFDWVRMVPAEIADGLNAQARRLLGFDTRLPTSLDEFFLPEDQRLYKSGQG
jgi:ectoine hydroxylase-related dioxygenase (phytanoyl-CoA dioxygenase family)